MTPQDEIDLPDRSPLRNRLALVEAEAIRLAVEVKHLRTALRAIQKGLTEDADGEFWTARRWLDKRKIYHGDVSGHRVLEMVAKTAFSRGTEQP